MVDPLGALLAGTAVVTMLAIVLWPRHGLVARARRLVRLDERVLIEDALKHLYDAEYRRQTPSVQSLAGALNIPTDRAVQLLGRMERLGLFQMAGETFQLTPEGRTYALRIIRIHRLWERHFAEDTGWHAAEWHRRAEEREHTTSIEEAEELSERLGHPRFDPHGDPIPTASGELPQFRGRALTTLAEGESGAIIHLEDEPEVVFSQLVAQGLHPGMKIQLIENSAGRLRFWADGDEQVLAPVLAANVTVVQLEEPIEVEGPFDTLASLKSGERGAVIHLLPTCRGLQRRRLMDLGILPGTEITAEFRARNGEPTAYRIRGALVALRYEQAKQVCISRREGDA
jgi:DtxR family Mn-dependent transcriptional regulator